MCVVRKKLILIFEKIGLMIYISIIFKVLLRLSKRFHDVTLKSVTDSGWFGGGG